MGFFVRQVSIIFVRHKKEFNVNGNDLKQRSKERYKHLKEVKFTPSYYLYTFLKAVFCGVLATATFWVATPDRLHDTWVMNLILIFTILGSITYTRILTFKEIDEDLEKWNKWSEGENKK